MLRYPTLNQVVLLQSLIGLGFWMKTAIFLQDLKCKDHQGWAARGVHQQSRVPPLPAAGALFQVPGLSSQAHKNDCLLPEGMGQVLPSPVAPVQPQRTKANLDPAWGGGRRFCTRDSVYSRLGKVFGTCLSVLQKKLGTLPIICHSWRGISLSCALFLTPLWDFQISRFAPLFLLDASGGVADH